jgi:hypothetical protein
MAQDKRNPGFDEIKRCLAEADRAFARIGSVTDERQRLALIEEAETWLVRAERRLARILERQAPLSRPGRPPVERRSFGDRAEPALVWRRRPHA